MNKKSLFEMSSDEKNRILKLHENATKKLYLGEQIADGEFSFPGLRGFQRSVTIGLRGIYSDRNGLSIKMGNDPQFYPVPSEEELSNDPMWLVRPNVAGQESTPYSQWVLNLNKAMMNDTNIVYIPTFMESNGALVWVALETFTDTARSKGGVLGKVGLGKKYDVKKVKYNGAIPTNQYLQ